MNQLTTIFKLLSDDTRLRMMVLLYQQELCVCQLSGILEAPQPRISKNLSKLRDLNLVSDVRKDKFIYYSLRTENLLLMEMLEAILDTINTYPQLKIDQERLSRKDIYITQLSDMTE